jgi:transcriptional regulator with XRE-family HTH domain
MLQGYGEFIKKHRTLNGYKSQRKFAKITGISHATISRIESEVQQPERRTLQALATYLRTTTLSELMGVCSYGESYKGDRSIIDFVDGNILDKFDIKVNGESLTNDELMGIVAFVKTVREMK